MYWTLQKVRKKEWEDCFKCTQIKREELDIVYSGDIAAAVGLKETTTGDTLCDESKPIILEKMEFQIQLFK